MRHPFTSWQVFSKNGILALLAKENKSKNRSVSSMVWSLDKKQMEYLFDLKAKDFVKQIENEIGTNLGKLNLVSKLSKWPINRMDVSDPTNLRAVVLGDASHSIYPLAGQGFNLGVGDIIQLLETLDWARGYGMDLGTSIVLNKYKNKRKYWVNSVTKLTDGLDWFFSNTTTQTQDKFGISLEILGKLKPLKQKLVSLMRNN
jgi:2-polyprenyl-6-methoxyphenol hydroxylase-like FAD-dependent oxidoreductase